MKVALFANPHGFHSMDRYSHELAASCAPGTAVERVSIELRPGWTGKLWDKYVRYPSTAARVKADRYLIASEGFSYLLPFLDRRRSWVVCLDMHHLIDEDVGRLTRWIYRCNLRLMARAQGIIAISEHTRSDLLAYCAFIDPEQVVVVHPGLGDLWRQETDEAALRCFRERHGLGETRFLLHVGSDEWWKNVRGVLEAFAQLDEAYLLVRVGALSSANVRLARRLGIDDRIRVVTDITNAELKMFYSSAELLLFPSLHEGFGWPPAEAMASGCPVVASDRASLPEVCADACRYVDPLDPADIAAGARAVLDDHAYRHELISKGRRQAANLTWDKVAPQIVSLLGG